MPPRFPTIVVATDLGPASDDALRRAHALAPSTLVVCHVLPEEIADNPMFPQRDPADALRSVDLRAWAMRAVTRRMADATERAPGTFEVVIQEGSPHAEIVRLAEVRRADLVVVGSTGATGLTRLVLGSVATRVARAAHCPVLVARPSIPGGPVLAATDLSDPSIPPVCAAAAEARATGASLVTLHCVEHLPPPEGVGLFGGRPSSPTEAAEDARRIAGLRLAEVLTREGVGGDRLVTVGISDVEIVRLARALATDLVVVGTHGRTGLSRLVLGSTAETVLRDAPFSVMVVRLAHA